MPNNKKETDIEKDVFYSDNTIYGIENFVNLKTREGYELTRPVQVNPVSGDYFVQMKLPGEDKGNEIIATAEKMLFMYQTFIEKSQDREHFAEMNTPRRLEKLKEIFTEKSAYEKLAFDLVNGNPELHPLLLELLLERTPTTDQEFYDIRELYFQKREEAEKEAKKGKEPII